MNNINKVIVKENVFDFSPCNTNLDRIVFIEWDYISADDVAHLNIFANELEDNERKILIETKSEYIMDILELVWISTLWETKLINKN